MSMMTITPRMAAAFISDCLDAGEIPCFFGVTGSGKSKSMEQGAVLRSSDYLAWPIGIWQVEDLSGAPDTKSGRTIFCPPDLRIFEDDKLKRELIVHLEEINHASQAMQGAIYEMLLNRSINNKRIHPFVRFVASCNPQNTRGAGNHLSTALRARMILARFENTVDDWLIEANRLGVEPMIISYISMCKDKGDETALNGFDAKAEGNSPNPRGWVKASGLWAVMEANNRDLNARAALIAGAVGEGRAMEFIGFVRMWKSLPDLTGVAKDPSNHVLPNMKETSAVYSSLGWLAFNVKRATLEAYMTYAERMGSEYVTVMVNMATGRDADLKNTQAYIAWAARIRSRSV